MNTLNRLTARLSRILFPYFEKFLNIHVTANEYYSPIPSVKDLPEGIFDREFPLLGIDLRPESQIEFCEQILPRYIEEYRPEPNGGLSLADAFVLYTTLRERKPRKMIEIGGGDSTFIAMKALDMNRAEGFACAFHCVEPYPRDFLSEADFEDFELVVKPVQDVDDRLFLDADVIFVDSSHVSKIGSDVNHEMFEIIPRVKVGALIHWHDIVIPTNYWEDWTRSSRQFWNESYLLQAFLMYNDSFEVKWASRWFQLKHFDRLKSSLGFLEQKHRNTSFWVERVK